MRHWNRMLLTLLVCVTLLLCSPFALAAKTVDVHRSCTLSIRFEYEQSPITGGVFGLYRVADVDGDRKFTAAEPFENVAADGASLVEGTMGFAAQVQSLNMPADYTLTTDETGAAAVADLKPGAWLLIGAPTQTEQGTYYVDPQMVILPREEAGEYQYDVTVLPKSTRLPTGEKLVARTVVKVWSDSGFESKRPKSITVRLLRDGAVYDRVVLSAKNNWRYTWTDLLPNANWTVEEAVPENYTMELQESEGVFTLTNHRKTIDQTGFVWWPVALICGLGAVLILVGILLRRSSGHEA